jgi:hypothetical protein
MTCCLVSDAHGFHNYPDNPSEKCLIALLLLMQLLMLMLLVSPEMHR